MNQFTELHCFTERHEDHSSEAEHLIWLRQSPILNIKEQLRCILEEILVYDICFQNYYKKDRLI